MEQTRQKHERRPFLTPHFYLKHVNFTLVKNTEFGIFFDMKGVRHRKIPSKTQKFVSNYIARCAFINYLQFVA